MQEAATATFSRLERLPMELQQHILGSIDDVSSLRSAALTGPMIYSAFRDAEKIIASSVLRNHVSPSLLPHVVTRLESINVRASRLREVLRFIAKHYCHNQPAYRRTWDLRSAIPIAKFHDCVEELTWRFVTSAASHFPNRANSPLHDAVSHTEVNRIQKTFYRFEVFCNLFRVDFCTQDILADDEWDIERAKDEFLAPFSPWENEQLACVVDWMYSEARPLLVDFAKHDIGWGSQKIDWRDNDMFGYMTRCVHGTLGCGLEHISKLLNTSRYESHKRLFSFHPPWRRSLLGEAFDRFNGEENDVLPRMEIGYFVREPVLQNFTTKEEQKFVKPQAFDETDAGPEQIWRTVHRSNTPWQFVRHRSHRDLLMWGYVLWDYDRIKPLWFFLNDPNFAHKWQFNGMYSPDLVRKLKLHEPEVDVPKDDSVQESFDARKKIFDAGGRGWWSKDDQSRIEWLPPDMLRPEPRSVRFLREMEERTLEVILSEMSWR